jgi:tRNA (guanine10-N2)-methyltransferase
MNTGSRRLITYSRIPDSELVPGEVRQKRAKETGVNADDLNPFRKGYFQGFKKDNTSADKLAAQNPLVSDVTTNED